MSSALASDVLRRWLIQMKLLFSLLMVLMIPLSTTNRVDGAGLHVATHGDDTSSGSAAHPFRTLERAQSEVRKRVQSGLQADQTVWIHQGTYELQETLVFDARDSGTEQFSVQYAALPGDVVVLSGGQQIDGWNVTRNDRWTVELPDVKPGEWFFRQLTVNDRRAIRARWPNDDGQLSIRTVSDGVNRFSFNRQLPVGELVDQNTELVVFQNWSVTRGLVTDSDAEQVSTATAMGWIGHGPATTASPGKTAFLEHARHFLDEPGEWFLDGGAGILHYIPLPSEDPANAVVVAPRLEKLVDISGTQETPVRNLHFRAIRFEHCRFALPDIGYNEIQASHFGTTLKARAFVQPVAIECTHAHDCSFQRCRFAHFNNSAVGFGIGCRANALTDCTVEEIGGTGIMIGWRGEGALEAENQSRLAADWSEPQHAPTGNIVSNCRIRRCGLDSFGAPGVFVAFSRGSQIKHNQICDLPYTGISVGFRWDTSTTSQTSCHVEKNHIFDVMKKLADGGGIYTLGLQHGTVLRGNYIHDVRRSSFAHGGAPNNGFFVDQGSKGFHFEANVVHSTSGKAVRFNKSQKEWHTWKNNHFGDMVAALPQAQAIIDQAGIESQWQGER